MSEQLIGLSLSSCIRFILEHNFPIDRVAKIICGGQGQSDENWEDRIDLEKNRSSNPTQFRLIGEHLRAQGKLLFPGEKRAGMTPFCGFGCWTTRDEFVIPMELYSVAASDFNRLSNEERVYTSLILEGEFDCLSNRVFEFNLNDIRVIRAKHKPGFRKAIARFFGEGV